MGLKYEDYGDRTSPARIGILREHGGIILFQVLEIVRWP
jgi:hypothetical protein